MADKKASKTNLFDDGKLEKTETPIDFLYRTGITSQIKDVMKLLLDSRPEDPIAFLAEYFDNLADISTALIRAHQKVCLVPYSRPAFYDNLMDAYDLLRNQKGGNGLRGLTGKTYNDMLTLLNREIPGNEAELLMKRIMCYDHEVVRFHVFRSGILSSLIYKEFLKQADSLYQELDLYERGKADKRLCDLCLKKLEDAVNTSNMSDPISIIQAGVHVSSKSFEKTALEVLVKGDRTKETISKEEFIKSARDIFLNQMPSFR